MFAVNNLASLLFNTTLINLKFQFFNKRILLYKLLRVVLNKIVWKNYYAYGIIKKGEKLVSSKRQNY